MMLKKIIVCTAAILLTVTSVHATDIATTEKPFYYGVFLYEGNVAGLAGAVGLDYGELLETHLAILKDHGVNVVHLAVDRPDRFDENLRLFKKYGMKLLPQLNFAYFLENDDQNALDRKARVAGEFIKEYLNHPQVLAWSVREEVAHRDVNRLAAHYWNVLQYVPDAKFYTLFNQFGPAKDLPVPDPIILGTDRYGFWWEFSGGGYLASPAFALDWIRNQAALYYEQAAKRGADFMFVTSTNGVLTPNAANTLAKEPLKMSYPRTEDEKMTLHRKVVKFAEEGRMGWRKFATDDGDFYNVWKWYRPPKNCTKAQAWIGVLEGAKLFLKWSYAVRMDKKLPNDWQNLKECSRAVKRGEIRYVTLSGRAGWDNPQFEEFAEAAKEIRQYERIITRMSKVLDACPVATKENATHCNAFNFPGMRGKVIVIQNSNVGTWPGESRYLFKEDDPIYIDDQGNMVDFVPFEDPMPIHFSVTDATCTPPLGVFDIKTGKELVASDHIYRVDIMPGSGALLYVGAPEDAQHLHSLMK